ncbi:unnamed protein product, partial [Staurois parvus]
WGPRAIGDHGAPVSLPKLKKAYEKGTRGISWGILLTPGPKSAAQDSECSSFSKPAPLQQLQGRGGLTTHGAPGQ